MYVYIYKHLYIYYFQLVSIYTSFMYLNKMINNGETIGINKMRQGPNSEALS